MRNIFYHFHFFYFDVILLSKAKKFGSRGSKKMRVYIEYIKFTVHILPKTSNKIK